ncbi:hypothetical protein [Arthrobacter sp. UM1]|uniref:hypothetical protein n=1 Tax=Arthrobacter sp. UM1 TaxID=2766776 RepID=UPI001CF6DAF1|nr:hypothetical protein [Arthrobacter sp. UM1]MCB4207205.1 hypothetical protein [Arthrobacter sp. UM1]
MARAVRFWAITLLLAALAAGGVYWLTPRPASESSPGAARAAKTTAPPATFTPVSRDIPSSAPLELAWPRLEASPATREHARVVVRDETCPLNAEGAIWPRLDAVDEACPYTRAGSSWTLPGSHAAGMSLIAGHTSQEGFAAFDGLYDWRSQSFALRRGDEMRVRTKASGTRWLVYRATGFMTPRRAGSGSLAALSQEWSRSPKAGRLFTVGCLQPSQNGAEPVQNIVIAWDFERVTD